jgi:hypothetical protein
MSTPENTRVYMIYTTEDITEVQAADSRIVPLRLIPQTAYGTSEAFRRITEADIPVHIQYVGFATPAFTQKTGRPLTDIQHPGDATTVVAFQKGHESWSRFSYIKIASEVYPQFAPLWAWLLREMRLNPFAMQYGGGHIYDNYWIADRDTALKFAAFARRAMDTLDRAPPAIQMLLYTPIQSASGKPSVTYHTILLEYCIMFYCDIRKLCVV